MGKKLVRARLATTHAVDVYGGLQLGRNVMDDLAAAVKAGDLPMHLNHDIRRPLAVEIVDTGVEELPDGEFAAWAEYLIDEKVWEDWQLELAAAGAPGGMSFTFSVPISPSVQSAGAQAQIAGDAAHYSDDELTEAAATLERVLSQATEADQLFQFNAVSMALVVIEFTNDVLASVGPNVLASALWDACKLLWRPGAAPHERSRFTVTARESRHGRRRLKLVIDVPDESALQIALRRAPAVLQSAAQGTFDFRQSAGDFVFVEGSTTTATASPPQLEVER
jgi:hypothetical protein